MTEGLAQTSEVSSIELRLFEAIPGNNLFVQVDLPRFTILAATESYVQVTGKTKTELVGKGFFEAFPANPDNPAGTGENDLRASFSEVMLHKKQHSLPVQRYDVPDKDNGFLERYWKACNTPVLNDSGDVAYIIHTADDITAQVAAQQRQKVVKGMEQAYNLFMQAPVAIQIFKGPNLIIELANAPTLELWGREGDVTGKPFLEVLPELKGQGYDTLMQEVIQAGKPKFFYEVPLALERKRKAEVGYFNFIYQPYYEEDRTEASGVLIFATEVTEQVLARKNVTESDQKALLAIESADLGTYDINLHTDEIITSSRFKEIWGVTNTSHRSAYAAALHPDDLQKRESAFKEAYKTSNLDYEARLLAKDRNVRWVKVRGKVLFDQQGVPERLIGVIQDITAQKLFAQELAKQVKERTEELEQAHNSLLQANRYLQNIINIFNTPLQVLKPVIENEEIVDFRYKLTNASYAAYASTIPENIRNKKVSDVFPGYLQTETFKKIAETCRTGKTDIWENHYDVDGLNIYNEMGATKMDDEVVVHFTDFTDLKNLQLELLRKIEELERSNKNLEEFAYAASHDLKEPIRKIHIFCDRLQSSLSNRMTEEEKSIFIRVEAAAKRMGSLIDDMIAYSQVSLTPTTRDDVDLNGLIALVLGDLDIEIEEKGAIIKSDKLFTIEGHHRQLQQAFQNLISNALKYGKPGVAPEITITCNKVLGKDTGLHLSPDEQIQTYYAVSIKDNGIGFEQQDADRIFNIFTRLHGNTVIKGTGIGLSIVRKVIENHHGFISAESKPGEGATFNVYLPAVSAVQ